MQQTSTPLTTWTRWAPIALIAVGLVALYLALTGPAVEGTPLSGGLLSANRFSLAVSGAAVLATAVALALPVERRMLGEWLLVGVSALAAATAADLVPVQSTATTGIKEMMVLMALGGILLVRALTAEVGGVDVVRGWGQYLAANKLVAARFLAVVGQLALLALVMRRFEVENQAIYHNIMLLALYGFVLHHALPHPYRLSFFALLSAAAIVGILGLANGLWLLSLGLVLIGLAHLPVPFKVRVPVLLVAGLVMGAMRTSFIATPIPNAIWPILGSMFMFRLIIYVYDLKFNKKPFDLAQTVSYFFMFPNIVFPFFPVVDFNTMRRTYYNNKDHVRIYQTGAAWIWRGLTHLILYRVVNYYLVLAPEEITSASRLAQFIITNYLLYLRVSGQFHIIIGLMQLFGFNLPVTNFRYYLASGFTDLWRRVNIYWKDFMQKVFFYPVHFRLKKLGPTPALMLATLFVIFMTWLLHAYQWFWLRGTSFFNANDSLFWTILGTLLILNIAFETKFGRKRSLGKQAFSWRDFVGLTLRTAGMFTLISVLWTMWTSPSIGAYLALWEVAASVEGVATLLAAFLGLAVVLGAAIVFYKARPEKSPLYKPTQMEMLRPALLTMGALAGLFLIGTPAVYGQFGGTATAFMDDITVSRLSDRDAALLQRGYYEDLIGVDRFNPDLWNLYSKRPNDWPLLQETSAAAMTGDFQLIELTPSSSIVFHGAQFTVNSFGMRDKEYSLVAAPDTARIVLLGPSYVMGSGVNDEETFEWLIEERLNDNGASVEILNFGVAGYSVLEELYVFQEEALAFQPDMVLFVAHHLEDDTVVRNLANSARKGFDIPYPFLRDVVAKSGVTVGMEQQEAERLMTPFAPELVRWAYGEIVATAEANDMEAVYVYMPTPDPGDFRGEIDRLLEIAAESGFHTIDLADVYAGLDLDTLIVAPWDRHPNAEGHAILAKALLAALENEELVPGR